MIHDGSELYDPVIPAQAEIQFQSHGLGSRLCGDDILAISTAIILWLPMGIRIETDSHD